MLLTMLKENPKLAWAIGENGRNVDVWGIIKRHRLKDAGLFETSAISAVYSLAISLDIPRLSHLAFLIRG
jgi:hypothetical protein